jgi:hypothetical protein
MKDMIMISLLGSSGSVEKMNTINIYSMACYAVMAIPYKK